MKYAYHTKWYDKWYRGGANHPHYSPPQCHLSLHLVWYAAAHFIFYSVLYITVGIKLNIHLPVSMESVSSLVSAITSLVFVAKNNNFCISRDTAEAFGRDVQSCSQHSLIIFTAEFGASIGIVGLWPCLTASSNCMDTFDGHASQQNILQKTESQKSTHLMIWLIVYDYHYH